MNSIDLDNLDWPNDFPSDPRWLPFRDLIACYRAVGWLGFQLRWRRWCGGEDPPYALLEAVSDAARPRWWRIVSGLMGVMR